MPEGAGGAGGNDAVDPPNMGKVGGGELTGWKRAGHCLPVGQ